MKARIGAAWIVSTLAACAALATSPIVVDDLYHSITTFRDMNSLAVAIEAYGIDHKSYPAADADLAAALAPYMRKVELLDAWGNPIKYVVANDGKNFVLVSAGSDGKFDEASWSRPGVFFDSKEDAVFAGHFVRKWAIDVP